MAMRQNTVIAGLVVGSVLGAAGALAAPAVQDDQSKSPAIGLGYAVGLAAKLPTKPDPPAAPVADWVSPADGEISSGFGGRWGEMHNGVDIANDIGTPIRAASEGIVIDSGPASGYGMWIRIAHRDDVVSIYGHIDENFVSVGQQVRAGQLIATMGDRGESTGPHLHFQIEVAGRPVDPENFYRDANAELTDR
ncbi:M23 family metallopeptidase [Saccharopolyspora pogona]|uniref:M23 family metallopeptidase n=1 Tax=Saccharopolyspora pogona TaxID=333966 RepID=UPI001686B40B|nr:M23 family metallopeptidase [Saccharopolyspora pogona]